MMRICLDIETYGAVEKSATGQALPAQTVFHPRKMVEIDGVSLVDLIQTVQITVLHGGEGERLSVPVLSKMEPGTTRIFHLSQPSHIRKLRAWLAAASMIVGHNIGFDLLCLRFFSLFRDILDETQPFLVDTSILNYLVDENRPEKSLKDLGPLYSLFKYDETLKGGVRFPTARDKRFLKYAGMDPHNTSLLMKALSRHILQDFGPDHPKASPRCLQHYSDTLWVCQHMADTGIPMSRRDLGAIEEVLAQKSLEVETDLLLECGLQLSGTGSGQSRQDWIDNVLNTHPSLRSHKELELTPKKKLVSFGKSNLALIRQELPGTDEADIAEQCLEHSRCQKLLSSYTSPLLRHARNNPGNRTSRLVRSGKSSTVGVAYPTWFPTPGRIKDDSDGEGGTKQGRLTCKNPSAQTFPYIIKDCIVPRHRGGWLRWWDLSQIELRVPAMCCGEESMVRAYNQGIDLHRLSAAYVFDIDPLDVDDEQRQIGKMVNFADQFRAGADKMAAQALNQYGVSFPLTLFSELVRTRPTRKPRLWEWQEELIREASSRGYLTVPVIGQTRYFLGGEKYEVNEIVNCPIQTIAANVLVAIQQELRGLLPKTIRMCMQVYDSILFEGRTQDDLSVLSSCVETAVENVASTGLWEEVRQHYQGPSVPLVGEWSEPSFHSATPSA
jgi:DNA polymerase I-like protein with 3'-5' exonuclease and polymerase domains